MPDSHLGADWLAEGVSLCGPVEKFRLPTPISAAIEISDKKIELLYLSLYKQQLERPHPEDCEEDREGKNSLCLLVKTNSERFLCLWLHAKAPGVKGVEKCPHSWLTAVEPELMGVRAPRRVVTVQNLICSRVEILRGSSRPILRPCRHRCPRPFKQKGAICDSINRTCGQEMACDGMCPTCPSSKKK